MKLIDQVSTQHGIPKETLVNDYCVMGYTKTPQTHCEERESNCKQCWDQEVRPEEIPIRQYFDSRGHVYFVRAGLGENCFKTFCRKPDKAPGYGEHGCRNLPWRTTPEEAQKDLDALALRKKWKEIT